MVVGTLTDLWPEIKIAQTEGYGVFVVVNEGGHDDDSITGIRAVFIDGDDIPMPKTWHVQPSFFVQRSATQWHAYFFVRDMPVESFRPAQLRLAAHYGTDSKVCNPSRVMRLAGTLHLKDPSAPFLMGFEEWLGIEAVYSTAEVLAGLPTVATKLNEPRPAAPGVTIDSDQNIHRYAVYLDSLVEREAVAIEGQHGDAYTLQVAMKGGDLGCSMPKTLELMLAHFNDHCRPPWDADELEVKVINAYKSRTNGVGCDDVGSSAEAFGKFAANHVRTAPAQPAKFLYTIADILTWPDPIDLVETILVDGELICHFGPPKSGKSYVAIDLALSIASGVPLFGKYKIQRPGPVIYLSGEGHSGMKRRMRAWASAHGLSDDQLAALPFRYRTSVPNTRDAAKEAVAYVEGIRAELHRNPALVVIDTMARTLGGMDEDASGDATMFLDMIQWIRDGLNSTMWCIGHTGKDVSKGLRGSSNYPAGFDTMIKQERDEKTGLIYIGTDMAKDAEPFGPLELKLQRASLGESEKPGYSLELTGGERPAVTAVQETASLRKLLEQFMRDSGMVGFKRGLQTGDLADAYTANVLGPCPPATDDGAHMAWQTERNQMRRKLTNGTRSRNKSKLPTLTGLFHEHALPGSTENTIFWHLEE